MARVRKTKAGDEEGPWVTRSGTVITEEHAERLADDFESEELDPTPWERRYVGRPSLGDRGVSPRVSFRASPALYKAAWKRADKEGRSLSELAREALRQYLDP
jgi:Ribbon-helix-helix protein, copG family